jgi:DNA-binding MarR family transcriptional regulator
MESTFQVTAPQRLVIRIVGRFPSISAGEVSAILHLHPSTLTGILKRLARSGLLARRADPRDARRALLQLTARGRAIDALRAGTVEAAVRRALRKLKPAAVRSAREAAETLTAELQRLVE